MTAITDVFRDRLANGEVIIIDGGMGPELARRGVRMDDFAWAATAVFEDPDTVRAAHADYIRAGAEAIITNTFMGSYHAMRAAGRMDQAAELNRRSVEVAIEAREEAASGPVLIAGSMFPGSMVADLDTMMPKDMPDPADLAKAARDQAQVLIEAGADVIALEMPPTATWTKLALAAIGDLGAPLWICPAFGKHEWEDGSTLVHPNDPPAQIGEFVNQILHPTPNADIMAIQVMHTEISDVDEALDQVERYWDGVLGVYPHQGEHSQQAPGFLPTPLAPEDFLAAARTWVDRGVQIIGGCCGVGPEHIAALKGQLPERIPASASR